MSSVSEGRSGGLVGSGVRTGSGDRPPGDGTDVANDDGELGAGDASAGVSDVPATGELVAPVALSGDGGRALAG